MRVPARKITPLLSIRTRLIAVLAGVAVVSVLVTAWLAFQDAESALREQSFAKLTAVREIKANQVEDYFQIISDQVAALSENRMVIDAMEGFSRQLPLLEEELGLTDAQWETRDVGLQRYYQTEFLPRLNANLLTPTSVDPYWPSDRTTRTAQQEFISTNPFDTGEKDRFDGLGTTSYGRTHRLYHPILRRFQQRFGYYDLFLVDSRTGQIVYSVFKEVDFGTSLLDGPYRGTNLGQVFRATRSADRDAVRLADFEPYDPSYAAPASFIASPIYDGDEQIGVLIFQMPVDRLNSIMTSKERWSEVGLGDTGETYIVGPDFTLRNQSRFLLQYRDAYLEQLAEAGVAMKTVQAIDALNSSIGLQPSRTQGTEAALAGEVGTATFRDYRDVEVLSAYRPLAIAGLQWALMSEIDEQEALQPARDLRNRILWWLLILTGVIVVIAAWFARTLTRPLKRLSASAATIAAGDLDVQIDTAGADEIGELARSFAEMQRSVADLVAGQERQIEALTTPLIPLRNDVVVLPIVGELDPRRSEKLSDGLVKGTYERSARVAIIDLTGTKTTSDTEADHAALEVLMRGIRSVRLLGVDVVITGTPAQLAKRIAASELDLSGIWTEPTLQMGIDRAAHVRRGTEHHAADNAGAAMEAEDDG